jgi:uncharacterized damage-inducible protein DinB
MLRSCLIFLAFTLLALSLASAARGQSESPIKPTAKPRVVGSVAGTPTSGFRAEFLEELAYCEQRYLALAEAMPAEQYSWRPAEGMRTVGGLFAHVVIDNYKAVEALDQAPPAPPGGLHSTFQPETILALSENKPKLLEELKSSFAELRARILKLSDADLDKPQTMMDRQTTLRGALLIVDRHLGEHLGQAIAYARINGLVPPWKQELQQQKRADKPKP